MIINNFLATCQVCPGLLSTVLMMWKTDLVLSTCCLMKYWVGTHPLEQKLLKMDWLGNLANYKEDYNAPLFDFVCTVTVMIFCSRCDASLVYWLLAHLHLKAFCYLCTVNVIFQ